jgi:hypothetical protein
MLSEGTGPPHYSVRFSELTDDQCVECYKEQEFGTIIPR